MFVRFSFRSFLFIYYWSTFDIATDAPDDANEAKGQNDNAEKEKKNGRDWVIRHLL